MATYEEILRQIAYNESRGIPTARNPSSSAGGMFQFIDTTWGNVLRRMNPEQYGNMTNKQLAPLKTDPRYVDLQQQAAQFHLQNDIAPTLEKRGVPLTPGTAYLSWFQGPAGAAKLYNAPQGAKISEMFPETISANANMKFNGKPYAEWTREDAIGWANSKMGGTGQTPAMPTQQQQPATQMADIKGYLAPASAENLAPAGTWSRFGQDLLGGATGGLLGTPWSTPAANAPQPTQVASAAPVNIAAVQPQFPSATPGMADKVTLPESVGQPTMPQMPGLNVGTGYQAPPASAMQPAAASQSLFNPPAASTPAAIAGNIGNIASIGASLMAAGAPRQTWQPGAPAPVQRGQWRDIIFSGLLG